MKICLFQKKIKFEDYKYNLEIFKREIIKCNCDLILFPELSLVGFTKNPKENYYNPINELIELSIKHNIAIGIGYVNKIDDSYYNEYSIINKNEVVTYQKIHLFSYGDENLYYTPGNSLKTIKIKDFNIGLSICYDLRFPEQFQALGDSCDLIITPSFWPESRINQYNILLAARAIENQCYTIGINGIGDYDNLHYNGCSCCYNPKGEEIVLSKKEENIIFEINNDIKYYREKMNIRKDRIKIKPQGN